MGVGLLQAVQGAGLVEEGPVGPAIHLVSLGMFFCWTSIRLLAIPHREGVLGSGMEQRSARMWVVSQGSAFSGTCPTSGADCPTLHKAFLRKAPEPA